jgi:hypothetical protein
MKWILKTGPRRLKARSGTEGGYQPEIWPQAGLILNDCFQLLTAFLTLESEHLAL